MSGIERPVWIEGEGVIDRHGHWFTEDQVRGAIAAVQRFAEWFETLPTETQDFIKWECGQ